MRLMVGRRVGKNSLLGIDNFAPPLLQRDELSECLPYPDVKDFFEGGVCQIRKADGYEKGGIEKETWG